MYMKAICHQLQEVALRYMFLATVDWSDIKDLQFHSFFLARRVSPKVWLWDISFLILKLRSCTFVWSKCSVSLFIFNGFTQAHKKKRYSLIFGRNLLLWLKNCVTDYFDFEKFAFRCVLCFGTVRISVLYMDAHYAGIHLIDNQQFTSDTLTL